MSMYNEKSSGPRTSKCVGTWEEPIIYPLYPTPTQLRQGLALGNKSVIFMSVKLTEQSEDTFSASITAKHVVRLSPSP